MLLWEALSVSAQEPVDGPPKDNALTHRSRRLPYENRCAAITKAGIRCRGRIRGGTDFCLFHDPAMISRRRAMAARSAEKRRQRTHLPDGYLRKLTTRSAVGEAMDRLYREIRLGVLSHEMGVILYKILTRLLDTGLAKSGPCPQRSKASRLRPKLEALLTCEELAAWERAMEHQAGSTADARRSTESPMSFERAVARRRRGDRQGGTGVKLKLQPAQ